MPTERPDNHSKALPCPACGNRLLLFSACTVRDGLLTKTYLCAGSTCLAVFVIRGPLAGNGRAGNDNGQGQSQGRAGAREHLLDSVNVG